MNFVNKMRQDMKVTPFDSTAVRDLIEHYFWKSWKIWSSNWFFEKYWNNWVKLTLIDLLSHKLLINLIYTFKSQFLYVHAAFFIFLRNLNHFNRNDLYCSTPHYMNNINIPFNKSNENDFGKTFEKIEFVEFLL